MSVPYVAPGDHRRRDACGRLEPRNPFKDPVVLFRALPGLAEQFQVVVPDSHAHAVSELATRVSGHLVECVCGASTGLLPAGSIVECPGACGRWFVDTGVSVRVAKFEQASGTAREHSDG